MQDSRLDRYDIFVAAAIIGAEVGHAANGFRHRDVLFMIGLFTNWVETTIDGSLLEVQNSQIARYLNTLITEGAAKKINKKGYPRYKLTRTGLVELITRVVRRSFVYQPRWFFFAYYFIKSYSDRVLKMIEGEGRQLPTALRLECEELFDTKALVNREIASVKRELATLKVRIDDSFFAAKLAEEFIQAKRPLKDLVSEITRHAPYDLDSQKPLSELIAEIPADLREWELSEGNERRAKYIFQPTEAMLKTYLTQLENLKVS
ncbi:MAG: hypothetical protein ACOX2O_04945 [Bdellovibrionota bacterium]|jgi:hypothetical protein